MRYLRRREIQWVHSQRKIVGDRTYIPSIRALFMSWLLDVALDFHIPQETLYRAVGMIDGTLAMRNVDNAHLQLVAITSLLIAGKLDKYRLPIKDLLWVTEDSYSTAVQRRRCTFVVSGERSAQMP